MSFSCRYETPIKNIDTAGFLLRENKGIFNKQDVRIQFSVSYNTVQNRFAQETHGHLISDPCTA